VVLVTWGDWGGGGAGRAASKKAADRTRRRGM
jgi:hypothetical protein